MKKPAAINATSIATSVRPSVYPQPFAVLMERRFKRRLSDEFGLSNFGVNLTTLAAGGSSALRHSHSKQDEFIFVISGHPTLHTDEGLQKLAPGMCAGFKAGTGNGHRLVNDTNSEVTYIEIGDRSVGDEVTYPDDDLKAVNQDGTWYFFHKDGTPY